MSKSAINSKDKNNLLMSVVLIVLIALSVVFFKLSRALPLIYLACAIEAFEILYVIPQVYDYFYRLYGIKAGAIKFVPYCNVIMIFDKPIAILSIVAAVVTIILTYLAAGPMFWVTLSNIGFFTDVQYRALGWAIVMLLVWSIIVGIGYIRVYKTVISFREELTNSTASVLENAYCLMLLLPILRCFALTNLLNNMKILIQAGYEYGKDYTELELEEE